MKLLLEGIDRLGKTSIAEAVQNRVGYHTYFHCSKPEKLARYSGSLIESPERRYQKETFHNMFKICETDINVIFDRAHLGETVYGPTARGYDGDYVFNIEKKYNTKDVTLILLYADPDFIVEDDGNSLNQFDLRPHEQEEFIRAFNKSSIKNKKMIKVNNGNQYRPISNIINEVIKCSNLLKSKK